MTHDFAGYLLLITSVSLSTCLTRPGEAAPVHNRKLNSHGLEVKATKIKRMESGKLVTGTARVIGTPETTLLKLAEDYEANAEAF